MPNIILTRIDNRLIHGQVATMWSGVLGVNLLLVANDKVATDEMRQSLMNMAAPSYAQTRYFTIEKTCAIIGKASPIKKVNIGNMHMAEGKRQVATSVAVDDADVAAFKKLRDLGVELEIQRVPDTAPEDLEKLFK